MTEQAFLPKIPMPHLLASSFALCSEIQDRQQRLSVLKSKEKQRHNPRGLQHLNHPMPQTARSPALLPAQPLCWKISARAPSRFCFHLVSVFGGSPSIFCPATACSCGEAAEPAFCLLRARLKDQPSCHRRESRGSATHLSS